MLETATAMSFGTKKTWSAASRRALLTDSAQETLQYACTVPLRLRPQRGRLIAVSPAIRV